MKSRPSMFSALVAGMAMTGFTSAALAAEDFEQPDSSVTGEEPSPAPDQRYHDQQVQPERDPAVRERELPPVGAQRPGGDRSDARAASPTAGAGEYVVESGDTLADIAQQELGDAKQWKQIAQLNGIDDPSKLAVGKRLRMPARDAKSRMDANDESGMDSNEHARDPKGEPRDH